VLVVRYATGSARDSVGYAGLAHLTEYLTFRGSRHLRPHERSRLLDAVGSGWNDITRAEHTT
jgi:predicted Zn-dependent peptidase